MASQWWFHTRPAPLLIVTVTALLPGVSQAKRAVSVTPPVWVTGGSPVASQ